MLKKKSKNQKIKKFQKNIVPTYYVIHSAPDL